jgi:hypothetical protein
MTGPHTRGTREALVEAAAGAYRPRRPGGGTGTSPAWHDLDAEGRQEAFRAAALSRRLEAALDPEGLSSTARAVLARVRR